jgi:hypothetical protein
MLDCRESQEGNSEASFSEESHELRKANQAVGDDVAFNLIDVSGL